MDKPTPRVNSACLPQNIHQTVRLVGKVEQILGGNVITLRACDDGLVTVKLTSECTPGTTYVEILGKVLPDRSVQSLSCTNFGDEFDMKVYNELIKHTRSFPEVFG